jgi:cytochrome c
VYATQCASCHGVEGEGFIGPPVIGSGAALGVYANGKRLLDYIEVTMPQSNPGGLSDEQYLQVLAYILVLNGFAEPDWSPQQRPPEKVTLER